jgi:hypothetical protein
VIKAEKAEYIDEAKKLEALKAEETGTQLRKNNLRPLHQQDVSPHPQQRLLPL